MKKVIRSSVLKGIAFVVCLVCVAVAGMTLGNATQWFYEKSLESGGFPYEMDFSFDESDILNRQFSSALNILDDALRSESSRQNVAQQMETSFVGDYYAELGDVVLKNIDLTREEVEKSPYYVIIEPGSHYINLPNFASYLYQTWDQATYNYYINGAAMSSEQTYRQGDCILLRLTEGQAAVLRAEWEAGRDIFNGALTKSIAVFFIALIAFIYLLFAAGRRPEDEEVHLVLIDRMFVEFNLLLIGGTVIGTAALVFVGLETVFFPNNQTIVVMTKLLTALLVCAFALVIELLLSLVRNLKNRSFVQRSLILRTIRWCWRTVKRICCWFINLCKGIWHGVRRGKDSLWHKTFQNYKTRKVMLVFFGYSAALAFFAMMFGVFGAGLPFFLGIMLFGAAAWLLLKRIDGFDQVVDALKRLRGGDLAYKLTDMPAGVFASMAEDINSLGDGMQLALQNEVRAERMKSELITNVSHDLKTPLTSILNYSDLLCQEHLTPEEANDYAKIIYQKGMRLKNLTSDLFDISKVQSGAEQIFCERLDACTLVRQALGEQDQSIGDGKLALKVDLPEHEVPIWADGKKMSRVMENLLGNCIKYAMPGTRVFISVIEKEGNAIIELKNIANYIMDFDVSEITERFVRGDAARSTEGSGLGLAIAKSYVEACGGVFEVSVDGDLFKVQITFAVRS